MRFLILILSLIFVVLASQPSCPPGFKLINNKKCLKMNSDHIKHSEAEQECRRYGGTITSIHNAIDNRALINLASNSGAAYIWIGMFCFGNRTSQCYYDDGSGKVKFNNFAPGNPKVDNESVRDGGCVYAPTFGSDAGKWYSGPCEWTGIGYACEVPVTIEDPSCTYNHNGLCYFPSNLLPIPDKERSYYETEDICHVHSMELFSIHSRKETDYIKSIFKGSGITELTLGAHAYQPGSFDWSDGTDFNYENFDPLSTTKGNCLEIDLSDRPDSGMWTQSDCLTIKYFMCTRKAGAGFELRVEEPKFKGVEKTSQVLNLSGHCNSTILVAPGAVTSLGYPNPQAAYCTWKLAALGPYNLGLYFTDFSVSDPVYIYGDNNTFLASFEGDQRPFSFLAPSNLVTLTHDSTNNASDDKHGFSVTILPF